MMILRKVNGKWVKDPLFAEYMGEEFYKRIIRLYAKLQPRVERKIGSEEDIEDTFETSWSTHEK